MINPFDYGYEFTITLEDVLVRFFVFLTYVGLYLLFRRLVFRAMFLFLTAPLDWRWIVLNALFITHPFAAMFLGACLAPSAHPWVVFVHQVRLGITQGETGAYLPWAIGPDVRPNAG